MKTPHWLVIIAGAVAAGLNVGIQTYLNGGGVDPKVGGISVLAFIVMLIALFQEKPGSNTNSSNGSSGNNNAASPPPATPTKPELPASTFMEEVESVYRKSWNPDEPTTKKDGKTLKRRGVSLVFTIFGWVNRRTLVGALLSCFLLACLVPRSLPQQVADGETVVACVVTDIQAGKPIAVIATDCAGGAETAIIDIIADLEAAAGLSAAAHAKYVADPRVKTSLAKRYPALAMPSSAPPCTPTSSAMPPATVH
jgi:hypothetical protein